MATPRLLATGRIEVTSYDSRPYDTAAAFTISNVEIVEEFFGGLTGVGSMRLVMAAESGGGASHFTGMEKILGKLGEKSGSFVIQNSGTLTDGVLQSTWRVIPGSATEQLSGLNGEGGCNADGYALEYWFE